MNNPDEYPVELELQKAVKNSINQLGDYETVRRIMKQIPHLLRISQYFAQHPKFIKLDNYENDKGKS